MKQKELNKTFMMISTGKNGSVSMVYTKIFQRFKSLLIRRDREYISWTKTTHS